MARQDAQIPRSPKTPVCPPVTAAALPPAESLQPSTASYSAGRIRPADAVPSEAPRRAPERGWPTLFLWAQPTGSQPFLTSATSGRSPTNQQIVVARSSSFSSFFSFRASAPPMDNIIQYRQDHQNQDGNSQHPSHYDSGKWLLRLRPHTRCKRGRQQTDRRPQGRHQDRPHAHIGSLYNGFGQWHPVPTIFLNERNEQD